MSANTKGIGVKILGDSGPFSRMGKSISYLVSIADKNFLIDCGSPLFKQIGGHGLKGIDGVIITHCHDDHKRWFTDFALFQLYSADSTGPLNLYTTDLIAEELERSSGPSLERSLSGDSKRIINFAFSDYVNHHSLGPRARFKIIQRDIGGGELRWLVVNLQGEEVPADQAKVVISPKGGVPRMLFLDPEEDIWVEPESYYSFSDPTFYEQDSVRYSVGSDCFLEVMNAPVWHGLPTIGLRFITPEETLVFSSDTMHDTRLWRELTTVTHDCKTFHQGEAFGEGVIYGDINAYIEKIWSSRRYEDALNSFEEATTLHDVSHTGSVVHTDYELIDHHTVLNRRHTILTHSPDRMTSEWVLSMAGKEFRVVRDRCFEVVDEKLYPLCADVYHKDRGLYYVGFRNPRGEVSVHKKGDKLFLEADFTRNYIADTGEEIFRVDLFEDFEGYYLPILKEDNTFYRKRRDGQVERIRESEFGCEGTVVTSLRSNIYRRQCPACLPKSG